MSNNFYPGSDNPVTLNYGLALYDMSYEMAENFITIDANLGSGGGAVSSVFGRTGAVVAQAGDYSSFYLPASTVLPGTTAPIVHEWLASYNASTGAFTISQPSASDLSNGVSGTGAVVLASAIAGFGSGTVTSFSSGNLSPLFTSSVATATTTPSLTFSLSSAAIGTYLGNFTGSVAAPTFGNLFVVNAQSATYQVLATDFAACKTIIYTGSTASVLTLVASTSQPASGQFIFVLNDSTNTVTITRSGQNLNGGTSTIVLSNGTYTSSAPVGAFIWSDGTNYWCLPLGQNAVTLIGKNWAAPAAIGSTTPAAGTFTTLTANTALNLGASGTLVPLAMANATSGTLTLEPVTGALGTVTMQVPVPPNSPGTLTQTIASGTATLGTGAISSGTAASVVTVSASGVLTTDVIIVDFNADPTSTTGYSPSASGMLTIVKYPTANNVNFKVVNNTASSITPGAVTLNWRVVR